MQLPLVCYQAARCCRRIQLLVKPLMTRGLEARRLTLGCLRFFRNTYMSPLPMDMVVLAVHMSKANKQQKTDDFRALTHHADVLQDPLFLLGFVFWCRLDKDVGKGGPIPQVWVDSTDW